MRKLADLKDTSSLYIHIDKGHFVTYQNNDSYNAFDMFFDTIRDGFKIEFRPTYYYGYYGYDPDATLIIAVSKDGFYSNHSISNISDKKAVILEICEFIKSATDKINKKIEIDRKQSNE